jgi:DNA (cytosine-5)-methyltransferase 1
MNHASLFSGIGGFDLAAQWMGWNNIFHCEYNDFCRKILKHYWPNAISYGNIYETDFTIHSGTIDILTGGFPCQPFSAAGKRKGTDDNRFLWPQMLRAIREAKPTWIVAENVPGLLTIESGVVFERVCTDLENEGYEVQAFIIPACATNAPHRRDRIWIVAYSNNTRKRTPTSRIESYREEKSEERKYSQSESFGQDIIIKNPLSIRCDSSQPKEESEDGRFGKFSSGDDGRICDQSDATDSESSKCKSPGNSRTGRNGFTNDDFIATNSRSERQQGQGEHRGYLDSEENEIRQINRVVNGDKFKEHWFEAATRLCIVDDGLSRRLDGITVSKWRKESLMAAGNAIVPSVAFEIFKAIEQSTK